MAHSTKKTKATEGTKRTPAAKLWTRRIYQTIALRGLKDHRCFVLFWLRQGRKSSTMAEGAVYEMGRDPGRLVTYASVSLLAGREIIAKEAQVLRQAVTRCVASADALHTINRESGKEYQQLDDADFADLFQSQRMELRLYHDQTTYSRTQVIAPNPVTARGWTGSVFLDEAGSLSDFEDFLGAVEPIISTDRTFRMIFASNLPKDDRHPFFRMSLPPLDQELPVNPEGNWYRGQTGYLIHRVCAADAYAAGHQLYDLHSGDALTLEQFRGRYGDKAALRYNYDLVHEFGGAAAVDLLCLWTAQKRGAQTSAFVYVDTDADFERALHLLAANLGAGPIGLGVDLASTTKETSNPTAFTVIERRGVELLHPLIAVWKTKDPRVQTHRFRRLIETVNSRPEGGKARRLCIDASNERLFAEGLRGELGGMVPVELVINGVAVHPPGYEEPTNYKTWLGDKYCAELNDNHCTLPSDSYIETDYRLVMKDRGQYVTIVTPDGMHGDTFDSGKNACHALTSTGGAIVDASKIFTGANRHFRPLFHPSRLRA